MGETVGGGGTKVHFDYTGRGVLGLEQLNTTTRKRRRRDYLKLKDV